MSNPDRSVRLRDAREYVGLATADAAATGLSPAGDLHASPETRRGLARTYLRRGIEQAVARARNER